ncbi:HAD family hydrolase [Streptomyces sp. ODS28]|uniref:HAD family hydrolase n=1 Tax=Streptomyces sp. ODS28 TaxID=3136688 RepID=UPI0031E6B5C1
MAIDTVLFDLDDTLCDQRGARRRAQERAGARLREYGIERTEVFWREFEEHEPPLFKEFAEGRISKEAYRIGRFSRIVAAHVADPGPGAGPDPGLVQRISAELNALFLDSANSDIDLFDDVLPTLTTLERQGIRSALFTNGPSDGQRRKIRALGLDRHLPHLSLFISEELGHAKPAREAFGAVLAALSASPECTLMVGDSPETDIAGARASGLAAVLLDRGGRAREEGAAEVPCAIRSLDELLPHLTSLRAGRPGVSRPPGPGRRARPG